MDKANEQAPRLTSDLFHLAVSVSAEREKRDSGLLFTSNDFYVEQYNIGVRCWSMESRVCSRDPPQEWLEMYELVSKRIKLTDPFIISIFATIFTAYQKDVILTTLPAKDNNETAKKACNLPSKAVGERNHGKNDDKL